MLNNRQGLSASPAVGLVDVRLPPHPELWGCPGVDGSSANSVHFAVAAHTIILWPGWAARAEEGGEAARISSLEW